MAVDDLQILTLKTNYASAGMVMHAFNPMEGGSRRARRARSDWINNLKATKSHIYMRLLCVYLYIYIFVMSTCVTYASEVGIYALHI